jgi:hypothetical protein
MLDEVVAGAGGLATNADSMLALMKHYIIWAWALRLLAATKR